MKKIAIGCLVVLVVGGAAVVGIGYLGYTRVRSTVAQFQDLAKIPDIEEGVRVKTAFVAPTSGELTAAEVEKYMQVQNRVRDRLKDDFATLERNYKSLAGKKDANITDLPTLLAAYRDMAAAWLDAKRAQVAALNDVGLSLEEYRWIRSQAYRAAEIPLMEVDFAKLASELREKSQAQIDVSVGGAFAGPGPAANVKLVEKYKKQLEDYLPLASFGL